ncbi:hypothetical protein W911_09630 [Hyphomicrobium nitrativorans NL23]|uniref:Phytoene synthase n=1 Tax=Hyphomicrobium nitrativorans NL23 TaxID=1029756 RepID=V5SI35_9HYPH|nr:squalene/phytoene synthase family protein [Hyphomicrobium nitrativorans]AHB50162.1 hypothetical protein W911_09630 [Hyphomicrobium nitrativorans NL23]
MGASDPLTAVGGDVRPIYETARDFERDRYLAALLAPKETQDDLVTLAAYLGELQRIPLLAHDATIGEIRFQWWRDALQAAPDVASGHPVADAVRELAARRGLSTETLLLPIEGRSRELYEDGIRDEDDLLAYADEAEGGAFRIAHGLIVGTAPSETSEFSRNAGRALAFTRLALSLPQHLALGRLPLPAAFVGRARDPRGADEGVARGAARELSALLAVEARAYLARFRGDQVRLEGRELAAFLPLCLVEPYLQAALRPGRDALLELADISPLSRVVRLWFARWRGRI